MSLSVTISLAVRQYHNIQRSHAAKSNQQHASSYTYKVQYLGISGYGLTGNFDFNSLVGKKVKVQYYDSLNRLITLYDTVQQESAAPKYSRSQIQVHSIQVYETHNAHYLSNSGYGLAGNFDFNSFVGKKVKVQYCDSTGKLATLYDTVQQEFVGPDNPRSQIFVQNIKLYSGNTAVSKQYCSPTKPSISYYNQPIQNYSQPARVISYVYKPQPKYVYYAQETSRMNYYYPATYGYSVCTIDGYALEDSYRFEAYRGKRVEIIGYTSDDLVTKRQFTGIVKYTPSEYTINNSTIHVLYIKEL
jgi:hypothetical protein